MAVLKNTGGTCEEVSEDEISLAKAELGAEGIGCEPASATTLAGLKKLVRSGFVKTSDSVVLILTGHTLKDVDYMLKGVDHTLRGNRFLGPLEADAGTVVRTLERIYADN